ncbi:uncharacterized protein PFL1_04679 [Pseudozyma flocculosa PF-1]|uniref:Autophagy-related protein 14 n=1 Tax=Pseudozyma flocculosa PF-1 TaxID=1277687 RepID=A0A061H7D6_9BASI|nr:uncharacterized protein PFL1_04679 [Pseudozyma flocculosa PF-1]EPQ27935.1 hypothetical protein PFL1_04679 [Pseudozyma flocculosa PF-1]
MHRLSLARNTAKAAAARLLGIHHVDLASPASTAPQTDALPLQTASSSRGTPAPKILEDDGRRRPPSQLHPPPEALPDPFGEEPESSPRHSLVADGDATDPPVVAPVPPALVVAVPPVPDLDLLNSVKLRARAAQLTDRINELRTIADESRAKRASRSEALAERRALVTRRRRNLDEAWANLRGGGSIDGPHSAHPPAQAATAVPRSARVGDRWRPQPSPGAWPGDDANGFNIDAYDGQAWSTDIYPTWERHEAQMGADPRQNGDGTAATAMDSALGAARPLFSGVPSGLGAGALVEWLRSDIRRLEAEKAGASEELQRTRAILAKEAFAIFAVQPPPGADAKQHQQHHHQQGQSAANVGLFAMSSAAAAGNRRPSLAARTTSLTERYMPGAFAFGRDPDRFSATATPSSPSAGHRTLLDTVGEGQLWSSSAKGGSSGGDAASAAAGTSPSPGSNDWTIAGLVLPLPSDVRRFPRDSINGAIAHTVHLLQLLTGYLGISLPFAIGIQGGKVSIRPNPLWDGGGGSSKQALHLSSAAYAVLSAPPAGTEHGGSSSSSSGGGGMGSLAESTLNLGASTLSTLESFIQLPPRSHLSWGRASTLTGGASAKEAGGRDRDKPDEASPPAKDTSDAGNSGGRSNHRSQRTDPGTQAARAFCAALVMLSYDIAYLAATQGVKVDLVSAGGSGLRLLHQMVSHPGLGSRSHANHGGKAEIADLSFGGVDYDQLVQLLEPMKASSSKSYASAAPGKAARQDAGRDGVRASSSGGGGGARGGARGGRGGLEQSYVDAGEAAASVLDITDPSALASRSAAARDAGARETVPASRKAEASRRGASDGGTVERATNSSGGGPGRTEKGGCDGGSFAASERGPELAAASGAGATQAKTKAAASSAGAVIFNGVEISAGPSSSSSSSSSGDGGKRAEVAVRRVGASGRRRGGGALCVDADGQGDEEGWDLV